MGARAAPRTGRIRCHECPLLRFELFRKFTDDELDFMEEFKKGELRAKAGATLLSEGEHSPHLYTVLDGWGYRYKTLEDGSRQIRNFALPGALLGLQNSMIGEMQHSVDALSDMVLCIFNRAEIWSLYERFPSLAFDVTWLAAREEAMIDEQLLNVGQRRALNRTAFLLVHLYRRAESVGMAENGKVRFPFTQAQLSDALGLSLVHTNKTLRELTRRGLVRWTDGVFEIRDMPCLAGLAQFDLDEKQRRPFL